MNDRHLRGRDWIQLQLEFSTTLREPAAALPWF